MAKEEIPIWLEIVLAQDPYGITFLFHEIVIYCLKKIKTIIIQETHLKMLVDFLMVIEIREKLKRLFKIFYFISIIMYRKNQMRYCFNDSVYLLLTIFYLRAQSSSCVVVLNILELGLIIHILIIILILT